MILRMLQEMELHQWVKLLRHMDGRRGLPTPFLSQNFLVWSWKSHGHGTDQRMPGDRSRKCFEGQLWFPPSAADIPLRREIWKPLHQIVYVSATQVIMNGTNRYYHRAGHSSKQVFSIPRWKCVRPWGNGYLLVRSMRVWEQESGPLSPPWPRRWRSWPYFKEMGVKGQIHALGR